MVSACTTGKRQKILSQWLQTKVENQTNNISMMMSGLKEFYDTASTAKDEVLLIELKVTIPHYMHWTKMIEHSDKYYALLPMEFRLYYSLPNVNTYSNGR